jgi:hypothetical protein
LRKRSANPVCLDQLGDARMRGLAEEQGDGHRATEQHAVHRPESSTPTHAAIATRTPSG